MADRDLTPDQQNKIHEACKKFSGATVYVRSYASDPEAARLITEIKSALQPTLKVENRTGEMLLGEPLILGIRILPGEGERDLADALIKAFRNYGSLSVEDLSPLGSGSSVTEILVGLKPVALAKEIVGRIGPDARRLNAQQQERIGQRLLPFAGQKLNLFGYSSEPEVIHLANDIIDSWRIAK